MIKFLDVNGTPLKENDTVLYIANNDELRQATVMIDYITEELSLMSKSGSFIWLEPSSVDKDSYKYNFLVRTVCAR